MDAVNLLREQKKQVDKEEEAYSEEDREIGIATLSLVCIMNSTPSDLIILRRPHVPSIEDIITQCSHSFGKQLTKSDINGSQSRLLIKKADAKTHIYPLLREHGNTLIKDGVPVKVFNEYGKVYDMVLKSWCGNGKSNVLTTGWTVFVKDMGLKSEVDYVTLWAFIHRLTGDLCFLIAVRRRNYDGSSSSSANRID